MNTQEKITDLEKYLTENNVAFDRQLEERCIASYYYGEEWSLAQLLHTVNFMEVPTAEARLHLAEGYDGDIYLNVFHRTTLPDEEYFETLCNHVESLHGVAYRNKEEYELYVKLKLKYEGNQV